MLLAKQTHGFVGADLAALAREAAIRALRRYLPDLSEHLDAEEIPEEVLRNLRSSRVTSAAPSVMLVPARCVK